MKFSFIFAALAGLTVLAGPVASAAGEVPGDAQRVVALLDYVGGDYGRAVHDGKVVSDFEYEEQLRFLADARGMAAPLLGPADGAVIAKIDTLEQAVRSLATPEQVAVAARAARDAAMARFGITAAPASQPSLARAQTLYGQNCASCHGARGGADTPLAATLDPAPASFQDPQRRSALSPYRVFNTLTFGVPGTAMASFGGLAPEDRWSLAFFVFRLGHGDEAVGAAAAAVPAMPLAALAARSDGELLDELRRGGHPQPESALGALRRRAPFEEPRADRGIEHARRLVGEALVRFPADAAAAERLVLDAYLDGFEPVEAQLSARHPDRVRAAERAFGDLRAAMADADPARVQATGRALLASLEQAEAPGTGVVPFVGAFLIYFREGLEAALLVGALLAGVRRLGRPDAARAIHQGWMLAVVAGVATWWIAGRLLDWSSLQRELLEAGVSLAAAAVLFMVSFWLISKAESRRWMEYLRGQLEKSLDGRSRAVLAGLAFLAVYREAAETVLFTQALLLDAEGDALQVWGGAAAGTAAFLVAALVMQLTVRRLPLGPFFAVSSLLLCALAVSFAGAGMHDLVAAGVLRPRPIGIPEIPWMGIHPDLAVVLVQLGILGVIGWGALTTLRRRRETGPLADG